LKGNTSAGKKVSSGVGAIQKTVKLVEQKNPNQFIYLQDYLSHPMGQHGMQVGMVHID